MATPTATWDYRERFGYGFARTFYRRFADCVVSSVVVGTYLGDATDEADANSSGTGLSATSFFS
jgi:hypothetical protein